MIILIDDISKAMRGIGVHGWLSRKSQTLDLGVVSFKPHIRCCRDYLNKLNNNNKKIPQRLHAE